MRPHPFSVLLVFAGAVAGQSASHGVAAQVGKESAVEVAGGRVAIHYRPVAVRSSSLERLQAPGHVWSLGVDQAAELSTDVALYGGKVLIPPGRHRLSTWFRKRGDWRLLVFDAARSATYRAGTPYRDFALRHRESENTSELLRFEITADTQGQPHRVRLKIIAGKSVLQLRLIALPVDRFPGQIEGVPATYEFYRWPAQGFVQGPLRSYEVLPVGRLHTSGEFGTVYDLTCQHDGKGIMMLFRSSSLRNHEELLVKASTELRKRPSDEALRNRIGALQKALEVQRQLQTDVLVPCPVTMRKDRAAQLVVTPKLGSDGPTFEMAFGLRTAVFPVHGARFRRIAWR
ncbi:MAG: hypothetical protein KDC87_12140 [Planctomycetes bacterium]|nr:hypothetical protein [Planctomycetota bacterium]MCB9871074.1 hypothetical protein [Planctomycetota bacterium]